MNCNFNTPVILDTNILLDLIIFKDISVEKLQVLFEKNKIYVSNKWEAELTRIDKNNKDYYYINGFEVIKDKPIGFYKKLFHSCDGHWSKKGASEYSDLIYKNLIVD